MKFDQNLCGTCDMNSTLGSVVPLAMFEINTDGFFDLHAQVDLRCMLKLKQRSPLLVSRPETSAGSDFLSLLRNSEFFRFL